MNISNKTVLITGGGSGIGLEIAKILAAKGNQVIITGRNLAKLEAAAATLPHAVAIAADITDDNDVERLVATIVDQYPDLALLVNNAGHAYAYTLSATAGAYEKARAEIGTNYLAPIRLTEKLLPVLSKQPEAAVVNVSSIVAFAPGKLTATYSASKAALHSYTQALRLALADETAIRVFELMPPLVATDFSEEIGGKEHGMPAHEVAEDLITGLENDTYEIYVGQTADFRKLFFANPEQALLAINER